MLTQISRRDFLAKGSQGLVGVALVPYFLKSNLARAFATPSTGEVGLRDYYTHFEVSEHIIQDVISTALSHGGDYCDVYFQHSIANYIGLEDSAVNRAYSDVGFGVGIRVLKGNQTGYSFTEEITPKAMEAAAKTAASIAGGGKAIAPVPLKLHQAANYYPIETPWDQISIDRKIPYLQTINERVFALDPRIIKSRIWFIDQTSQVLMANSEGGVTYDYQPMNMIYVSCIAEENGRREQNAFNIAGRRGIEFFTAEKTERLAQEAVRRTVDLFTAVKPGAGEMELVLAAGSSGILLHEAIGHGMEADFNRKEISIYSDQINQPIAENFVTIIDDGTNPNIRGSINIDDEGHSTEKTYLVENGILRSYLHDRISAQHYGVAPTGSGRRESFRFAPMPRMRNTYMLPGPHSRDEILGSVKKGLYAEQFTNGQVFIGAGDFTFYVKSGYLIEDGELTKPVKDVNIIGNGPEVLRNVTMVADDFAMAEGGWTCGKNGQRVPVSMGLPTIKVSKITVGGVSS